MRESTAANQGSDTGIAVLAWTFYILALIVLLIGLFVALRLLNYQVNLSTSVGVLDRLGVGPLLDAASQAIKSFLTLAGILVLLVTLIISALLFTCGQLLQRSRDLALRVRRLEAIVASGPQPDYRALSGPAQ